VINLDKIYTVKSNAVRDMRKAIAKGELDAAKVAVEVVPTGYQIIVQSAVPPQTSMWSEDRAQFTPTPAMADAARADADKATALPAAKPAEDDAPVWEVLVDGKVIVSGLIRSEAQEAAGPFGNSASVRPAKVLVRTEGWPFAKAVTLLPRQTPQVPALPGMTPLGIKPAKAPQAAKVDYGLALTIALAKANVWAEKGLRLEERAGHWVPFESVHDSLLPHGLTKGQMPAATGNARKRGLIDVAWSDQIGMGRPRRGMIKLTAAGLAAHKGSV
jgi:hypothetical protein